MITTTAADTLRAAATRLVELVTEVARPPADSPRRTTGGNWTTSTQRYAGDLVIDCHDAVWDDDGTLIAGSLRPVDAAWIAAMSPTIAKPLVTVLVEAADNVEKHDPECADPECQAFASELALADAILGGAR